MKPAIAIIFFLNICMCYSHQDFFVIDTLDNVTVRIKTGFKYEEIKKIKILGELGRRLLAEKNYKNNVLIDFNHHYTGYCEPDYFISYDKGSISYPVLRCSLETPLNDNGIIIRVVSSNLNFREILTLLEYAVGHEDYIKTHQDQIEYYQNYCHWNINTIDTLEISRILNLNASNLVETILKEQVFIQQKKHDYSPAYYYQGEQYHFFNKERSIPSDSVVLSTRDIYYTESLNSVERIVFDTDSTFYYIGAYGNRLVSQRHIIRNTEDHYRLFSINKVGNSYLSLYFRRFANNYESKGLGSLYYEQTSLYDIQSDILVQDIRKDIIEKYYQGDMDSSGTLK